ncbi:MAG: abortive infection protein [Acidobacteria bacterium]|nr:abortive infection protein [Acidobacteriota bacterium]
MNNNSILFNEYGRLKSGWRFSAYILSYFILTILGAAAVAGLSRLPIGFTPGSLAYIVVPSAVFSAIAIFLGWFYGRIFEDLPFRALGLWFTKNWFKDLTLGLIIGAVSIAAAVLIGVVFGNLSFQTNAEAGSSGIFLTLSATLLIFTVAAVLEEAVFRGYLLQTLGRAKLFYVGAILTSFLFATAHNQNPGASPFSWINTYLAGIWLAVAYYKTRNLWFPTGVHIAWNWVQGAFFGINVSGLSDLASAPVLRVAETGTEFISGGEYGIEGGLACTIALIFSIGLIYFLPFINPTEEMLALTSHEIPKRPSEFPETNLS